MAGASMNDIKARMKSVRSTTQITKAMELVATSKLRRAKERAEATRPYHEALGKCIDAIIHSGFLDSEEWTQERQGRTLYIVIAGDRGLAGGYNSNVFRLTGALIGERDGAVLPIGKKAVDHFRSSEREVVSSDIYALGDLGVGKCLELGELATREFHEGGYARVVLVYTRFVSMLTQTAVWEQLLPLDGGGTTESATAELDGDAEEVIYDLIRNYIGGIIYSAVCESTAAEHGARRSAMNSANKNAEEMMDTLMLKFNRARQAVITQEITEIVSGAEAL